MLKFIFRTIIVTITLSLVIDFFFGKHTPARYIISTPCVSNNFVYLTMSYRVELHNRIAIGFAIGWSYHQKDKYHSYKELVIYLGLISITIKYYET